MWGKRREIELCFCNSANAQAQIKDVEIDGVVTEFGCLEGRRLTLCFGNLLHGVTVNPFFAVNTVPYRTALEIGKISN